MIDSRGEKRSKATHESSTDPQAKLMRKGNGQPAKLSFAAHALMENRNGLLVDLAITEATLSEPKAAAPIRHATPPGSPRFSRGVTAPGRAVRRRSCSGTRRAITTASTRTSTASMSFRCRSSSFFPHPVPTSRVASSCSWSSDRASRAGRQW